MRSGKRVNVMLEGDDRKIINELQGGFPISDDPFDEVAARLDMDPDDLMLRISRMIGTGVISRFAPMYHAEEMGGELTLAALRVPPADFERVAGLVNALPEVSQNYARDHELNMWFVIATEGQGRTAEVILEIEHLTGLEVFALPKLEEFYIGLRLEA